MYEAGIATVNLVEDTKVVVGLSPFHCTTESGTKPVPVTVSVNAAPPAVRDVGLMLEIDGAGAFLIVKVRAVDVPPTGAGLYTVTLAVPAVDMYESGINTVS